jgi:hypothetical protein
LDIFLLLSEGKKVCFESYINTNGQLFHVMDARKGIAQFVVSSPVGTTLSRQPGQVSPGCLFFHENKAAGISHGWIVPRVDIEILFQA